MFRWVQRIIDGRLVKRIVSREGQVHFRRWALFESPWLNAYIHEIARSDEEKDPHDHPWSFVSFILKGGYHERVWRPGSYEEHDLRPGYIVHRTTQDFHRIKLFEASAWTLVFTGPRTHALWGYKTEAGWVDHVTYRKQKHPS